jgi:hypothetical protein
LCGEFLPFCLKRRFLSNMDQGIFEKNSKKSSHFKEEHYEIAKIFQGFERELFEKNSKTLSHFKEEHYEIAKIFQGFGHMSSFLLLKLSHLATRF